MIDLDKIGYNVLEKDGSMEITGGLTLTVKLTMSSMIPEQAMLNVVDHAKKRIREKIWEMAYGHLKDPMKELKVVSCDPQMSGCHEGYAMELKQSVDKLEEAIGEP